MDVIYIYRPVADIPFLSFLKIIAEVSQRVNVRPLTHAVLSFIVQSNVVNMTDMTDMTDIAGIDGDAERRISQLLPDEKHRTRDMCLNSSMSEFECEDRESFRGKNIELPNFRSNGSPSHYVVTISILTHGHTDFKQKRLG
jgi:hypothetical protein